MPFSTHFKSPYPSKEHTSKTGTTYLLYNTIDSTHLEAERLSNTLTENHIPQLQKGIVLLAKTQTNGQGSFQRKWVSEKGGLYYTLIIACPTDDIENHAKYIQGIGQIVAYEIGNLTNAKLNWEEPNDLMMGFKKIGGILLQSRYIYSQPTVIIGIGLNLNQHNFVKELAPIACSLSQFTNTIYKPETIAKMLTKSLIKAFQNNLFPTS